jgi:hypothetical protein
MSLKNKLRASAQLCIIVCIIASIVFAISSLVLFKFSIYKKKYGDHMTFIEFVLDAGGK